MEELLFLQRITRHKEEIDHVTFQHQVSNERNGLVVSSCECVCVCERRREFVCICDCMGGWMGANVFSTFTMHAEKKI